jgi:hypothetical protein
MYNIIIAFDIKDVINRMHAVHSRNSVQSHVCDELCESYIEELAYAHFDMLSILINQRIQEAIDSGMQQYLPMIMDQGIPGERIIASKNEEAERNNHGI